MSEYLSRIDEELEKRKTELSARSKTSQLWLNYQNMVKVAWSLMKADRTGSWLMHLRAVSDCLPIFAALQLVETSILLCPRDGPARHQTPRHFQRNMCYGP